MIMRSFLGSSAFQCSHSLLVILDYYRVPGAIPSARPFSNPVVMIQLQTTHRLGEADSETCAGPAEE